MNKILSITLLLCLLLLTVSPAASAAQSTTFTVKAYRYISGSYQPVSTVTPTDTVVIRILADSPVTNVAGLSLTLGYDDTVLSYQNKAALHIVDAEGNFSASKLASAAGEPAGIRLLWDTAAAGRQLEGLLFSLEFEVLGGSVNTTELTVKVDTFFESDRDQTAVSAGANNCTLNVGTVDYSAFQALKDNAVEYNDATLQRIVAAETAFAQFSNAQQAAFLKNHRELYDAFAAARPAYNRLAQTAKKEEILKEANKFLSDFAALWDLESDAEELLEYEEQTVLADTTYQALSTSAKERIAQQYPEKIAKLLTAIDDRKYEISQAVAFREDEYSGFYLLWSLDEDTIRATYADLIPVVSAAGNAYNALSDYGKSLVKEEYEKLKSIDLLVTELAESDAKATALQEAVNAFTQKWSKVFLLNTLNVGIEDKSAIEMAIEDSTNLDAEVQTALANRINSLKRLLTVLEAEEPELPGETVTVPGETVILPGETVTVPGETVVIPGETVQVPGETVILPGETVTVPGETVILPGETVTVPGETVILPGETVLVPGETVTVPGETKTVTNVVKTSFEKAVLALAIIILFGLAITAIPATLLICTKKKNKNHTEESGGTKQK